MVPAVRTIDVDIVVQMAENKSNAVPIDRDLPLRSGEALPPHFADSQPHAKFWVSCRIFTVQVNVQDGVIVWAAPIVRKFVGQPLANLLKWQKYQVVDLND